ncbi:hypothetical protein FQU76_18015 [Streptomyces qinzhouensis]|uniref:DUF4232 domain-containing protein n=1 Tax=Streptomyces qinzhouensis TaxID=2599401 RepID=A0A5B8JSP5_9ACTN|nr:hypothetical protein FQU76_18015 [Streptomyces qinzhouensis]
MGQLLQDAVNGLQPADGALDRLRTAVPARRARKRRLVVGAVAAVVLTGTAVPALLHVAGSSDTTSTNTANAGHDQPTGGEGEPSGASGGPGGAELRRPDADKGRDPETGSRPGGPSADTSYSDPGAGDPKATGGTGEAPAGSSPACEPTQLGVTSAAAEAPDADGKVYGAFRVANVSRSECAVTGDGTIAFKVSGAADESKISVVDHTGGDAAPGLPAPAKERTPLLLKPDSAYEVRFAWVPDGSCPPGGPSPGPSTTEGTTTGGTGNPAGPPPTGTEPQLEGSDPAPAEGSVSVTHTADPGAPTAEATIPNACSGTIYRTGVLGG